MPIATKHWATLTHSPTTNLDKGKINNADATVLVIAGLGGVATRANVLAKLRQWRPFHFSYLFNASTTSHGYGFIGRNINSTSNTLGMHVTDRKWREFKRPTYWYRVGKGQYSLTFLGIQRLSQLLGATIQ
jgi:hypothetical protein